LLALGIGLAWGWNRAAKKWLKENGRVEVLPSRLDRLVDDGQQKPETTLRYSEQEFQEMVAKALDEVPEEFDKEWENVAVIVSTDLAAEADKKRMGVPDGHLLLGTYTGLDRTKGLRASSSSRHVIVVYQPALEMLCGSDKDRLEREIRRTVLHELAHHLGMSHQRIKEIGL
jgi:predicted Zn-dependent protease with MMP-like domain